MTVASAVATCVFRCGYSTSRVSVRWTPEGLFTDLVLVISKAALLGSLMSATTSELNRGRAVELERYDRAGQRS